MSGLEKSLDRYKKLKAEASRAHSALGGLERQKYVEDLETKLACISSTSQVSLLQQLERAERHIQGLEDRLATVVLSVSALKDVTEQHTADVRILSKGYSDCSARLAKVEVALFQDESSESLPAVRKRLRDVESMCDLEVLRRELKRYDELATELDSALKTSEKTLLTYVNSRCEEVEFAQKSIQTKWEAALSESATTFSISLKTLERRLADLQATKDGHSLVSSQPSLIKSQQHFDQAALDLVYDLDKQIRQIQSTLVESTTSSQKRTEELTEVKRFALETKNACSHIIEALERKVSRVEQLSLVSASAVQKLEEQSTKPLKLSEMSSRELKSLEAQLKQDVSQSLEFLTGLVQKSLSDQQSLSDSLRTIEQRLSRSGNDLLASPLRAFKEKREQSLSELQECVRASSSDARSLSSLKDQFLSVSFEPRDKRSASRSAMSQKPPRAHSPASKSLQPTPHASTARNFSPKSSRPRKKVRSAKRAPK